ncbi:Leucine-rich repeat-containing protein [Hirschfeldia incana]|nr:Leucine-rich repeat-containing protein [Hirschfeldia incana]
MRFTCGSVCNRINVTNRFDKNLRAFDTLLPSLLEIRTKVKKVLETMEVKGESVQFQLRKWLEDVEGIVSEATSLEEKRHSSILFLKWRLGYKLSSLVEDIKRLEELGVHLLDRCAGDGSVKRIEYIPGPSIFGLTTATGMLSDIAEKLMNNGIHIMGVWGMGGVGKTTLVKALNNMLGKEHKTHPFRLVVWATVSKDFNLIRVQRQITERLKIKTNVGDTAEELAGRICHVLTEEPNVLLILDDVWETIDLNLLGIPLTRRPESLKVVLTSRFHYVCRYINTDVDFRVECLSEDESWKLFCQSAGNVVRSDLVKPIAKAISRECGGLPLAIITVGSTLRGKKDVKLWSHALKELKRSVPYATSIEERVFKPLKLSFDSLDDKMKSCFLFCALFPEDTPIKIGELVNYWMAEGYIDEEGNHEESMNEGMTWIENLKDCCLLEDGPHDGTIKMHDIVRDFSIWVTSSSQSEYHSLIMSGSSLKEVQPNKFVSSVQRVSLMQTRLEKLPESLVECAQASTLLLQYNSYLLEVPQGFLQAFPALKILNLSATRVRSLPQSLSLLHSLQSLILRDCYFLKELPALNTLVKLQYMDLCATSISETPEGLEVMTKLRHLDLSRTHNLICIPAGTISKLTSLESLDMSLSSYHWNTKGQAQVGHATFEEIGYLTSLYALSITLVSVPFLSSKLYSVVGRLKRFQIFIGSDVYSLPTRFDNRMIKLSSLDVSEVYIEGLLVNATCLVLNNCTGVSDLFKENLGTLGRRCYDVLKSLTIDGFPASLGPSGGCMAQLDLFPNLEELHLQHVASETISELFGNLGFGFQRLKLLDISWCSKLKCVLLVGNFILSLPSLEEIRVSRCERLQELLVYSPLIVEASHEPVLPKLRVIKLKSLSKLKRICDQEKPLECLEQIEVIECNLLGSLPISSKNVDGIKEIRGALSWFYKLSWDDIDITTRVAVHRRFKSLDVGGEPAQQIRDDTPIPRH